MRVTNQREKEGDNSTNGRFTGTIKNGNKWECSFSEGKSRETKLRNRGTRGLAKSRERGETSPANRRFSSGKACNRPGYAQRIVAIGGV